ncbi:MAG: glycosyltransferase family 2 protein [Prolixibacteraceae bacterium]|jgi:glycosyltransferase involved in cell wall biosynthesis|nr:glycosyltransferase family 2 protein [Prolixibacteraceae bacterium]
MDLSIVIPLLNEEESLPELTGWIQKVMDENRFTYEIIFIDDGSRDDSWRVIQELCGQNKQVKAIRFQRNYGKSPALHVGFQKAQGDIVITMDADLQDNPEEIPEMKRMIDEDGFDLVSGWKKVRHDPVLSKNLPSKFYNLTVRRMTRIKLHDMNCGLKAYKKQVVKSIEVYGDMHRFIPVLAKWAGFKSIGEKVVKHQERKYGETKFGLNRFIRGPLDLISVMFISKFGKRPMHFFGVFGTVMFIVGFFAALWVGIQKLYALQHSIHARLISDNPYFYIALTAMIIGSQFFLAGFIADLVSRNSADRNNYQIAEETNTNN